MTDSDDIEISHFIRPGFDYAAYCKKIDQDGKLTTNEKTFAKDILNPGSELTRVGQIIIGRKREHSWLDDKLDALHEQKGTYTQLTAVSHPAMYKIIQDAWMETKQYYRKEIQAYNAKFSASGTDYPNNRPESGLLLTDLIQGGACIEDNAIPFVAVSRGFLTLPADEQRGIILHECAHLMEPVLAQMKPEDYAKVAAAKNEATQNAFSRSKELDADRLAATLGDEDAFLRGLTKTEELFIRSQKSFSLQQRYEEVVMPAIYQAAHASGFGIDAERCAQLSENVITCIDNFHKEIEIGTKTPASKNVVKEAPTHPPMEERARNIHACQKRKQEARLVDDSWATGIGEKRRAADLINRI